MNTKVRVVKNEEFGFSQVHPLPSVEELNKFYNTNYYDEKGYAKEYTPDEIFHKQLTAFELQYIRQGQKAHVLDVGCGEGFVIDVLQKEGWTVTGLDFSHDGILRHFPHLRDNVVKGDIYESLEILMEKQAKFDVIICNNVLEHVLDPLSFLKKFKALCHKNTIIRIQVPNDFSWFQQLLKSEKKIEKEYWVAPPGHLSYFNKENLLPLLDSFGYQLTDLYGDFPIELFLLNEKSNYSVRPEVGPYSHASRILFDVNLYRASVQDYMAFRKGCGQSGVCRNLIAYCKLK